MGYLQRELLAKIEHAAAINSELAGSKELLQRTSSQLQDYIENLDLKVSQRTETLEKYNRAIEEHKQKVEEALFSTMDPAVAKLLFAEASLELDKEDDIPIRGRKQTIHLFEMKGI